MRSLLGLLGASILSCNLSSAQEIIIGNKGPDVRKSAINKNNEVLGSNSFDERFLYEYQRGIYEMTLNKDGEGGSKFVQRSIKRGARDLLRESVPFVRLRNKVESILQDWFDNRKKRIKLDLGDPNELDERPFESWKNRYNANLNFGTSPYIGASIGKGLLTLRAYPDRSHLVIERDLGSIDFRSGLAFRYGESELESFAGIYRNLKGGFLRLSAHASTNEFIAGVFFNKRY